MRDIDALYGVIYPLRRYQSLPLGAFFDEPYVTLGNQGMTNSSRLTRSTDKGEEGFDFMRNGVDTMMDKLLSIRRLRSSPE